MSISLAERKLEDPAVGGTIIRLIAEGHSEEAACGFAGVHKATYSSWLNKGYNDPEMVGPYGKFYQKVQWAKATAEIETANKLIYSEDTKVAMWLLERRNPESWAQKQQIKVAAGPSPEDIAALRELPTDVLEKMLAEGNTAALAEAMVIDVDTNS